MQAQRVFLIPVGNVKVPIPDRPTQYLPENGMSVIYDQYWYRRIAEGCVKISKEPQVKKETKSSKKPEAKK